MPQWNQGIEYMCQWAIDDIPTPLKAKFGDVISVPYGLDLNDGGLYAIGKHGKVLESTGT
jgi:allantoinase